MAKPKTLAQWICNLSQSENAWCLGFHSSPVLSAGLTLGSEEPSPLGFSATTRLALISTSVVVTIFMSYFKGPYISRYELININGVYIH